MNSFEKLQVLLHKNPAGAPESEIFNEILQILFSPEEVEVALYLKFVPQAVEIVSEKAGLSIKDTEELCESMANKGIIFSREKNGKMGYALLPTIPGIFEFPFMTGGGTKMHDKLGVLWEKYHIESQGMEFGSSPTPLMRVIPVEETISSKNEVLPYEIISGMMEKNHTFAVAECACRVSQGEHSCGKPTDVCLIFDGTAKFLIQRKLAKEINKEEALNVLKKSEEAGLVHTTNNSQDRIGVICNCCSCCCTVLTCQTKINAPYPFSKGRWYAKVDESECSGCEVCADERCVVEAISLTDEIAQVDPEKCIGCGLCVSTCPEDTISMIERENFQPVPETGAQLGGQVLMEKGRLDEFLELNRK